jgi:hypothetical protein
LAPKPLFYSGVVNDPARPIFRNYGYGDSPRQDFVGAAYDALGRFWGGLVEQLGPPDSSATTPTSGYVARLASGPGALAASGPVTSVPAASCRVRRLIIRLPQPRRGRVDAVSVFVDGAPRLRIRGRRITRVAITPRTTPAVSTVTVIATTSTRRRIVLVRRYRGCSR